MEYVSELYYSRLLPKQNIFSINDYRWTKNVIPSFDYRTAASIQQAAP